jgi:threonine/homoserine/homoserine lactone efflux protein
MDPLSFALAVLALLLTPGPTNTLLAASGASIGFRRSIPCIAAEILGYGIAVTVMVTVAPFLFGPAGVSMTLRVVCGLYLVWTAWKLWTWPVALEQTPAVGFRRVFVTTLFNPKSVVMTFLLLPNPGTQGEPARMLPYVLVLAAFILMAGTTWIAAGALLRSGTGGRIRIAAVRKTSSVVLATFAVVLFASVVR